MSNLSIEGSNAAILEPQRAQIEKSTVDTKIQKTFRNERLRQSTDPEESHEPIKLKLKTHAQQVAHGDNKEEKVTSLAERKITHSSIPDKKPPQQARQLAETVAKDKLFSDGAQVIKEALVSGKAGDISCHIRTYFHSYALIQKLCRFLVTLTQELSVDQQKSISTFIAEIDKAIYENHRTNPQNLLSILLTREIAQENFRKSIRAYCNENRDTTKLQLAFNEAKAHAPVFTLLQNEIESLTNTSLKSHLSQLLTTFRATYHQDLELRFTNLFSSYPKLSTDDLHRLIDESRINGVDLQAMLHVVAQKATPNALAFIQRVEHKFANLLNVPYGEHRLNPYELLRITIVAESTLEMLTGSEKLKKPELMRSVLLDSTKKNFIIISGKHGPIQAEGAEGKIRSILIVGDRVLDGVQKRPFYKTGSPPSGPVKEFSPQELKITTMFMKTSTVVVYTYGGITQQCLIMERFTTDFTSLLRLGKTAFPTKLEMLTAFDQLLETVEEMHTHRDEFGQVSPIVHGDIKPANVLYKKGKTQLADFGFASEVMKEDCRVARHATRAFCPPEDLCRTSSTVTPKERCAIDMFSIGAIMGWYISVCEFQEGKGQGLWKPSGNAPWKEQVDEFTANRQPTDISANVISVCLALKKTTHPLADLASKLLDPNPATRMTVKEARAQLRQIIAEETIAPTQTVQSTRRKMWQQISKELLTIDSLIQDKSLPPVCKVLHSDFYPIVQDKLEEPLSDFDDVGHALTDAIEMLKLNTAEKLTLLQACTKISELVASRQ